MVNQKKVIPLQNLDELFLQSKGAICVNQVGSDVINFNEYVIDKLFFAMDGQLEFSATCACGKYAGNWFENGRCAHCGTIISSEFIDHLSHKNWIGIPSKMPPVLHPTVFLVLRDFLGKVGRVPLLHILLDPSLEIPENLKPHIKGQGFTYFYRNHRKILDFFFFEYPKTMKAAKKNPNYGKFFTAYYDIMFCSKLPILDPVLHPVSKTGTNKVSIDTESSYALNAINALTYSEYEMKRSITSKRFADKTLWKSYSSYIEYIESIIGKKLGGKVGHLRKQMFGIRTHFSFRSVIVPNTMCHMADEVLLPWVIGVHTFKLHLLNHLVHRHGYTWGNAQKKYQKALVKYDPEVHLILDTILAEAPQIPWDNSENTVYSNSSYGIPILFGRNPSLTFGSIYKLRIVGFKPDVNDHTIAFSQLIVKPSNA